VQDSNRIVGCVKLGRFDFPKSSRLVSNRQFRAVMARRLSSRDKLLVLYACENNYGFPRLGVSISKSCGNAVVRNRLKRLVREAFRQDKHLIPPGFDYVVSMSYKSYGKTSDKAIQEAKQLTFKQVRDSFIMLAIKLAGQRA